MWFSLCCPVSAETLVNLDLFSFCSEGVAWWCDLCSGHLGVTGFFFVHTRGLFLLTCQSVVCASVCFELHVNILYSGQKHRVFFLEIHRHLYCLCSSGSRGAGPPLTPKISSKSYRFQAILREKPLFWGNFGLRAPPWGQNSTGPPGQNPGSAPVVFGEQRVFLAFVCAQWCHNIGSYL